MFHGHRLRLLVLRLLEAEIERDELGARSGTDLSPGGVLALHGRHGMRDGRGQRIQQDRHACEPCDETTILPKNAHAPIIAIGFPTYNE